MSGLMRLAIVGAACAAFTLGGAAPAQAACADESLPVAGASPDRLRGALLCLINEERTARRQAPVVRDARLDRAAQLHSEDMVARNYFSHESPDGTGPGERITAQGYPGGGEGELIAVGGTPIAALRLWFSSTEGHCDAILDARARDFGLGVAGDRWTITVGNGTNAREVVERCPSKLARDGGGAPIPWASIDRPKVGSGKVTMTVRSLGRKSCKLDARLTRGSRTEQRTKLTLSPGAKKRFTLRLGKKGRAALRSKGRLTVAVEMKVCGASEDYVKELVITR